MNNLPKWLLHWPRGLCAKRVNSSPNKSMMKIPKPIQNVFDRFPLKTHPYVSTSDAKFSKIYAFSLKPGHPSNVSSSEAFVLAVHNIKPIDVNGSIKYIATDPIGLSNSLILCFSNCLCLPSDNAQNASQHSMMPLSYLASPHNELPIVVERVGKIQEIISTSELKTSVTSKYFKDSTDSLLNDLLDGFYDMWIFALIYDIPLINFSACQEFYYQDEEVTNIGPLITAQVLKDATKWGSFKQRYSHLFLDNFAYLKDVREILSGFDSLSRKCFEQSYFSKLLEFDTAIPLFMDFFRNSETSDAKSILQLKFASYFICIKFFIPKDTHLSKTVYTKHMNALDFSMELLSTF